MRDNYSQQFISQYIPFINVSTMMLCNVWSLVGLWGGVAIVLFDLPPQEMSTIKYSFTHYYSYRKQVSAYCVLTCLLTLSSHTLSPTLSQIFNTRTPHRVLYILSQRSNVLTGDCLPHPARMSGWGNSFLHLHNSYICCRWRCRDIHIRNSRDLCKVCL